MEEGRSPQESVEPGVRLTAAQCLITRRSLSAQSPPEPAFLLVPALRQAGEKRVRARKGFLKVYNCLHFPLRVTSRSPSSNGAVKLLF